MPVKITLSKPINKQKLINELSAAGFTRFSYVPDNFFSVDDSDDEIGVMAIYNAHDPNPTPAERASIARKKAAKENAGKAVELKNVSANQAVNDYERRIHGGITEAALNSKIDAVASEELKPVLKSISKMLYAQTKSNKILLRLLLGVADEVMPDR